MPSNVSIRGPLSSPARRVAGLTLFMAVAFAPRQAVADDAAERKLKVFHALRPFASAVEGAKATGDFGGFGDDVAACRAAIKDGTAAGYQPLDTFTATLLWKHVGSICDEYQRLSPMKAAIDHVMPSFEELTQMRSAFEATNDWPSGVYRTAIANAKTCVATVDLALEEGAPTEVKFSSDSKRPDTLVTLPDVRTQCSEFLVMAEKGAVRLEAGEAAAAAAIRGKYTSLGITGDRLKYLITADHRVVMGKGCKELQMAGKKKAASLYEMAEGDTYWVVYKMTFKGDSLMKTTEKRFNKLTSRGWSCK